MSDAKPIIDGGPAFPVTMNDRLTTDCATSLRDYFAAKALQGLFANPGGPFQANGMSGWALCNCTVDDIAAETYRLADAMLIARSANPEAKS